MKYSELKDKIYQVSDYISTHQVKDAFDLLVKLGQECRNKDLQNQLENHRNTYFNMLKYSFEMADDPEKEKVYGRLMKSVLELADDIKEDIILNQRLLGYYTLKADIERSSTLIQADAGRLADNLTFQKEIDYILTEKKGSSRKKTQGQGYNESLAYIFNVIWLTDKFRENEIKMVRQIRSSNLIPWYDKCILISALTLSLIRHFDVSKVNLLLEFYEGNENQVWQRAFAGFILGLYYHDHRIKYYPEIGQRLKLLREQKKYLKTTEALIIQFLKARETEKVTKKIREEIFPEMMRIKTTLEEKLNLDDLLSAKNIDEKNPEWETVFKDTPDLYDKLEEFSTLQMEGSDVFLSAFAMLKRFPFFNVLSNWFAPFYNENENVVNGLKDQSEEFDVSLFVEGLEKSTVLCNSDKYSFCLNLNYMPSLQKSMMLELFNREMKAMNELSESDELIDEVIKDRTIFTQYLQDLYRFYKLHPLKDEFEDIFEVPLNIEKSHLLKLLIEDQQVLRNIGEFYFEKNYYRETINIFKQLNCEKENFELLEKIAYSYQKLEMYDKAIDNYHKAELFDKNKIWVYKKMAFCYRKLGDFKSSLKYYKETEKLNPDDLYIQLFIGHTYMDMEDFETALRYYFKVEYLDPKNTKVFRPVAWCSFVLEKYDTAIKYFEKVISKEATKNDYFNLGHVYWCMGDKKKGIENYRKSLLKSGRDFKWLSDVFEADTKYLTGKGINVFDIPLMIDYLKMTEG